MSKSLEDDARWGLFPQLNQRDLARPALASKIYFFSLPPNQSYKSARSGPPRGAYRDRHGRWAGNAVDAAAPAALIRSQGGLWPVSDRRRGRRAALKRTAKPCGPGARGWRQVGGGVAKPDRVRDAVNSPMTEAKGIRLRGELGISRKTIARGMPECSGCTCMLVCASHTISCTRDRGCSKHPAFPAPSCLGETVGQARAKRAAGR